MMKELFYGDDPLEVTTMQRNLVDIHKVDPNGDCFYSSVLGLYNVTVQFPLGVELQDRMTDMQGIYWSGIPFRAHAHHLRVLCAKYLDDHWDHYFTNAQFKERLHTIAVLNAPQLRVEYTSDQIRKAYLEQMTSTKEWAGIVECDVVSELFGMKLEVWAYLGTDNSLLGLNSTFEPFVHAPVRREMTAWKWSLVQENGTHFDYIQPWVGSMEERAAENPLAKQVNEIDPEALRKLRTLARSTRGSMPFSSFQVWFKRSFGSLDQAVVQLALHLFFAALTYYFATKDNRASSSHTPALIEEMGPPMPMGTSIVDEIFDKHKVQKRADEVQTKGRGCA